MERAVNFFIFAAAGKAYGSGLNHFIAGTHAQPAQDAVFIFKA
jgi:hypothetical protein